MCLPTNGDYDANCRDPRAIYLAPKCGTVTVTPRTKMTYKGMTAATCDPPG